MSGKFLFRSIISTKRCSFHNRQYRLLSSFPLKNEKNFNSILLNDDEKNSLIDKLSALPPQFLRAADRNNYDPTTHQRVDIAYDTVTGIPNLDSYDVSDNDARSKAVHILGVNEEEHKDENKSPDISTPSLYKIHWSDEVITSHSKKWVEEQFDLYHNASRQEDRRVFWKNLTEDQVRASLNPGEVPLSMSFEDLIYNDEGMKRAIQGLYVYGILLVTDTPIADEGLGVAALGAALGGGSVKDNPTCSLVAHYRASLADRKTMLEHGTDGPLRTLYGSVWSTSSVSQEDGTSTADSAYGSDGLPLHTDMTYMRDPPGLQIFTMVQPAVQGGASVFADGFAVANELRKTSPDAFLALSETRRRYRSIDADTGWNLQATGTIISTRNGKLNSIRHNDLDRLPDLPPTHALTKDKIDAFYSSLHMAHKEWDTLLAQDEFRLVMKLRPGDTMVVANQRCFHGRYGFSSSADHPRTVMGCYASQDELSSRFRQEGFEDLF